MKDIVIIGAGGIGREVAWIIEEINEVNKEWNILGFVDDNEEVWGQTLNDYKVLGGIDYFNSLKNKTYVVIAMANPKVKKLISEKLNDEFEFATIIHPTVKIGKFIEIGKGTIIYPGVTLTVNTKIGNHVLISSNCGIGHNIKIGNYSSVLWGCNMSGYDVVGEGVFIGVGASVVNCINIDDGIVINAGEVVVEDMLYKK
ncbi:NeuD/PglB/VioB family sugar acetyltransferase [Clostridium disporicum]|uniref:Serine O-acetyltransferase n=1 Tax=Clostridium disporicum TaxID=84024 RepID=A0A174L6Q8_9CLOT|nr:NeuD/PglB/VioB family sugar acetyltransferase [Clostridium disporicum]CUP17100.1 serine O-acetyltransferase [Clostridium disporicum]